jgi:DNA (cytosine-5)-methyltransferase 1
MNFLDLFSGAGGLSEGFIEAGFNPIAHVEMDVKACKTIETRLTYHKLLKEKNIKPYLLYLENKLSRDIFTKENCSESISESIINLPIGGKNNKIIFEKIDKLLNGKSVDIMIGGPPCQAYSLVGRARDKNRMRNDERNYLYKEYAKFLKKYNPKVFVFENVQGLITANDGIYFKNMKSYFRRIGFHIDYSIQNSKDFGVLQNRKRVILIGWQKNITFSYPSFKQVAHNWKVRDLLSDLIELNPGDTDNVTRYATKITPYLKKFKLRNKIDFVTQHVARPHNKRDLEIYSIAIGKWLGRNERLRYPDLPSRLKTHKNEKSFTDRFKVVDPNGLSHTVVAHIAKDGHYYIYPDLSQVRSLSVREAARIQSFPDNFFFEGGRSAAFKQIGNAVPPLMAKEIALKIKQQLCPTH